MSAIPLRLDRMATDTPSAARPRLLDLFCGAGGAAMGYHRAGFDVVGVDIKPQPNYPFECVQANALELALGLTGGFGTFNLAWGPFAAIHASPPCQHYSDLAYRNGNADDHPDLIGPTRELLEATELPYVIENVEGAPLINPVTLCGVPFPDLRVIRHRLFETNWPLISYSSHDFRHPVCYTRDKRKRNYGLGNEWADYVHVNGGGNCTKAAALDAMGIDWPMTKAEVNEAIPPAYTQFIGRQLLAHIREKVARSAACPLCKHPMSLHNRHGCRAVTKWTSIGTNESSAGNWSAQPLATCSCQRAAS